jgi:hypothetical protein
VLIPNGPDQHYLYLASLSDGEKAGRTDLLSLISKASLLIKNDQLFQADPYLI